MSNSIPDILVINTIEERHACARIIIGSEPWITLGVTYDQTMDSLSDPLHEVFAAYVNGEIVGVIVIQERGAFSGYVKSIVVKKGWRDKHIGKAMMDFAEKRIFTTCSNVFLCVSSFNSAAQRFYKKLGYQVVGVLESYLVEGHDEILMRKTTGPILKKQDLHI
jgi:ribosomal protein S18 acetylase RimI-like enzyme